MSEKTKTMTEASASVCCILATVLLITAPISLQCCRDCTDARIQDFQDCIDAKINEKIDDAKIANLREQFRTGSARFYSLV